MNVRGRGVRVVPGEDRRALLPCTRLLQIAALLLVLPAVPVAAADEDVAAGSILGLYWLPARQGQLELYEQGALVHGRIVSFEDPNKLDSKNPIAALRGRTLVGIDMLRGFEFDPESKRWSGGTIYDPASGSTYDCVLWVEEGLEGVLHARGFIGFSLFGRTETFLRVARASSPAAADD